MAQEIERKFVLDTEHGDDLVGSMQGVTIQQGYLAIGPDSEARIRSYNDDKFALTVKTAGELVRGEFEVDITKQQFDELWSSTEGRRVEKTRFTMPAPGLVEGGPKLELDYYSGKLAGLLVGEIEFESPEAAEAFVAPPYFREVTDDKRYKNQQLALHGLPQD